MNKPEGLFVRFVEKSAAAKQPVLWTLASGVQRKICQRRSGSAIVRFMNKEKFAEAVERVVRIIVKQEYEDRLNKLEARVREIDPTTDHGDEVLSN